MAGTGILETVSLPGPDHDPIQLLAAWLQAARDAGEPLPERMALATATPDGCPSVRMVMLRGLDRGLRFFTDRESDKGGELAANPGAAVVLHWLAPEHRQVRVVGPAEPVSDQEADEYWHSRRPDARRSAAAWPQSQVVTSRAVLEERVADLARRYPEEPQEVEMARPSRWSGFRVVPTSIEFWQEAPDGLHDRLRYRRADSRWEVERLAP
jgi:pyridoxamine 5'-phosphate oxidase